MQLLISVNHRIIVDHNSFLCFMGAISTFEINISVAATKALLTICKNESISCAAKQILKSVVREIRTLRSVGVGAPIGSPFYPEQNDYRDQP